MKEIECPDCHGQKVTPKKRNRQEVLIACKFCKGTGTIPMLEGIDINDTFFDIESDLE